MLQGGGAPLATSKVSRITSTRSFALVSRIASGLATFAFAFFVAYSASSNFTPVHDSSAEGISIISGGAYYANITSSGTIDLNVNSTPDGAYNLGKDSLSISTNSTLGYKLYISTIDRSSDSPALPSTTPSNSLINTTDNTKYISPSTGTVTTPVLLETNTWGYTTSRSTSSDTSVSYDKSNAAPTTTEGGSAIWKAIPVYGSEDLFYNNTTPSTASTNSVDVYYAANVSTALPSGEYSNTVVYTAIVEGNAPGSTSNLTITPSSQNGITTLASKQVTISTGLYTGFTADNLDASTVTIGGNTCTNPVNSIGANGNLVITCNTPAQSSLGSYDIVVTATKNGSTIYSETLSSGYTYNKSTYSYTTCANTTTGSTFVQDGITYIKLADGNCWTKDSVATALTWEQANALDSTGASAVCPAGTHIPSAQEYKIMFITYGGSTATDYYTSLPLSNYTLSDITGWGTMVYWSSTEYSDIGAWYMWIRDRNYTSGSLPSRVDNADKMNNGNTLCVGSTVPEFYTITDMQQMNHSICDSVPAPTSTNMTNVITKSNWTSSSAGTPQTTLVDTRSGTALTSYTVRKLPDGKCWMTRNLRYAPTTATTLSSGSSDILSSNTWQIPAFGTANSGYTDYNGDEVYEGSYGSTYDATYYSWHTATAGTGTSDLSSGNTTQSICPKGWRLPTSGDGNGTTGVTTTGSTTNVNNGDFKQLDIAFGGTGANNQAGGRANWVNNTYGFNAALIGHFDGTAAYSGGSAGLWWSSSVISSTNAYHLHLNTSVMSPQYGSRKGYSFALRCVAR